MRYVIVFIFLLLSCGGQEHQSPPDNLIEKEVMVNVLYDLAVFQAEVNHNRDPEMNKSVPFFLKTKYGIDSLQFVQSNKYYASQIEEYQKMYDQVYDMIKVSIAETEKANP